MLKELQVTNFKAWRRLDMRFGKKVTGLFGNNSSGKSSVLQFLLLLKQTKNATDRGLVLDFGGANKLVNLGTDRDVVHRGQKRIDWTLDWDLETPLHVEDPNRKTPLTGSSLQQSSRLELTDGTLSTRHVEYQFANKNFVIESLDENPEFFQLQCKPGRFRQNRPGPPPRLPRPIKTHLFPDKARTEYRKTSCLSDLEAEYETLMDKIFYLGPLREYPQRQYILTGAKPDDVGPQGERTIDAILAATVRGNDLDQGRPQATRTRRKKNRNGFQEVIAKWLKDLKLVDSFQIKEIRSGTNLYQACVRMDPKGPETMLTDVGFGVSQVLPVLVLLYYVPEGSIVMMEQPEIHLHPSVQSGLADVMLAVAENRRVQIIVESHSEHLLRRFQRRVAEGETPASDLKLYFVGTNSGAAQLNDLELNEWGEIRNWPDNFFGDEMGEIFAISEASLERRMGASQ